MQQERTLLVEGEDDKKFFTTLLKHELGFSEDEFSIEPPKTAPDIHRNGFNTLLSILPSRIRLLRAGKIKHLGIVVDADSDEFGFAVRRKQITDAIQATDPRYAISEEPELHTGEIFHHPELPSIGLWIMPNHSNDGIFEDFLLQSITESTQKSLRDTAIDTVDGLGDNQLFGLKQTPKAHLSTWLSWQASPGMSAGYACYLNLFDKTNQNFTALTNWLDQVFSGDNN